MRRSDAWRCARGRPDRLGGSRGGTAFAPRRFGCPQPRRLMGAVDSVVAPSPGLLCWGSFGGLASPCAAPCGAASAGRGLLFGRFLSYAYFYKCVCFFILWIGNTLWIQKHQNTDVELDILESIILVFMTKTEQSVQFPANSTAKKRCSV